MKRLCGAFVCLLLAIGVGCTEREGVKVVTVTVDEATTATESQSEEALPAPTTEVAPTAEVTPAAASSLTRAEYRRVVRKGADAVAFVLDRVASSHNYRSLLNRTQRAHEATRSVATNLDAVDPPPALKAAHDRWAEALRGVATALERIHAAVRSRSLCVAPAAMARISQVDAVQPLNSARRALADEGIRVAQFLPALTVLQDRSLLTGQVIVDRRSQGLGEWRIENGLVVDAVVAVTNTVSPKRPAFSVYVQAGDTYTIRGLGDGVYDLFFTVGKDWDANLGRFTQKCDFTAFDEPSEFVTTATQYTIWDATLHPVEGGTGRSSPIAPDEFPSLR